MGVTEWLLRFFAVVLLIADQHEGSNLTYEHILLCEHSSKELLCPDNHVIENVNMSLAENVDIENICRLSNEDYFSNYAKRSILDSCIGNSSCIVSDTDVDFSQIPDISWQIRISFYCVHTNDPHNEKPTLNVCPYDMSSINCSHKKRKIKISSIELLRSASTCNTTSTVQQCEHRTELNVNKSCNNKQQCLPNVWTTSTDTWDDCIKIPKVVNISFSCKEISSSHLSNRLPAEENTKSIIGISLGVIGGLAVIVCIGVAYFCFVKRSKHTCARKKGAHAYDNTGDYIGNHPVAMDAYQNLTENTDKQKEIKTNFPEMTASALEYKTETHNNEYDYAETEPYIAQPETKKQIISREYAILDPLETGFCRTAIESTDKESRDTGTNVEDQYISSDGQYNHLYPKRVSGETKNIYSHSIDNMYDVSQHDRTHSTDQTYDHCFGQTTDDDYDVSKVTHGTSK